MAPYSKVLHLNFERMKYWKKLSCQQLSPDQAKSSVAALDDSSIYRVRQQKPDAQNFNSKETF